MKNNSYEKGSSSVIIAVVIVVVLIATAVYASQRGGLTSHAGVPAPTVGENGNQTAPDFSLATLDGGTVSLADYRGRKPVVLDFWATWCPNCRRSMPVLNGFYEKYKDQIEIVGINLQENPSVIQKFVDDKGINFPIALDPHGEASRAYGVRYTNFHVLIDIDGNVVKAIPGDLKEEDIISLL